MSATPEEIQEEIEATRGDIREDIEALQDKLSPHRAAQRGVAKVGDSVSQVRDRLMGTAEQGANSAKETAMAARDSAHSAKETAAEVPDRIRRRAQGNPLAMGLGAFALGWLVASLIPATDAEKRAAHNAADAVGQSDLAEPLVESARTVAERAQQTVGEAAREVGREASEGAQEVAENARGQVRAASAQM